MKKVIVFLIVAGFYACNCLPQIPTQYLPADQNCEAVLPNYLIYVSVFDNCEVGTLTQDPLPGTVLNESNPFVTVTITAQDLGGRMDTEQFTAVLDDGIPPEIIWDSIPGDTIPQPVVQTDGIDEIIRKREEIRAYHATMGRVPERDTVAWRKLEIYYPPENASR